MSTNILLGLAWRVLVASALFTGSLYLNAQCAATGETKVVKPVQGTGYRFYKFLGDCSYVYFLDGKAFSLNEKDDPGKTVILIDDFAYEPLLVRRSDVAQFGKR